MSAEESPTEAHGAPVLLRLLSERERQVLDLVVTGRSNKEIARALQVSPSTVGSHMSKILMKLGVDSRTEAAVLWDRRRGEVQAG